MEGRKDFMQIKPGCLVTLVGSPDLFLVVAVDPNFEGEGYGIGIETSDGIEWFSMTQVTAIFYLVLESLDNE